MKQTIKKSLIILCVILIFTFSSLAYPIHQAKAAPVVAAVPAAVTAGAGAYLTGGLMLAGVAGVVGAHEYQKAITDHSWNVWDGGTQAAKDNMAWTVQQAKGAGNSLTTIGQDVIDWSQTMLPAMATANHNIMNPSSEPRQLGVLKSSNSITLSTTSANSIITEVYHSGTKARAVTLTLFSGNNLRLSANDLQTGASANISFKTLTAGQGQHFLTTIPTVDTMAEALSLMNTYAAVMAGTADLPVNYDLYNQGLNKIKESWESMRDAGLVLPVDGITTHVGDVPVKINSQGDAYTNDAGQVYNPSDVTHSFPLPRIRTQDVPQAGVYTDTPAMTGNPAIDEAIVSNPAIPKTTTNIYTGTTIANPDIATGNPAIPTNPPITTVPPLVPPFDAPGSTGLDFTPLMMTGEIMKNKFPFSIPFDFVKQISVFNVEPESPKFNINIPEFIKLGSFVIPFKMDLSFEMFDPIANIIRWGMIIIWDIALILSLRRLLPE